MKTPANTVTEALVWHPARDGYPEAEKKVLAQYLRPGVDKVPQFYFVYTDGDKWFDADQIPHYSCEEPDYWAELTGVTIKGERDV